MKKSNCSFSVALVVLPKVQLTLTRFPVSGVVAVLVVKKATLTSSVVCVSATLTLHVSVTPANRQANQLMVVEENSVMITGRNKEDKNKMIHKQYLYIERFSEEHKT